MSDETFDFYRCESCRVAFLQPIPKDLGRYYPESYYDLPRSKEELLATAQSLQTWKLDIVKKYAPKGRLLEIGPAYGLFAALAQREGFDVTVVEMDARCCSFLRATLGIEVLEGSNTVELLEEVPAFDVIVIWQVIEHLPDPWKVLSIAAGKLAPDGVLIVDTPNPDAFQFSVLRSRWAHVDAPRHVVLIPAPVMIDVAKQAGLEPVLLTANGESAKGYNGFGWATSLQGFFADSTLRSFSFLLGRVIAKLLIPIERTGWRGSTYTGVFRRKASS